MNLNDLNKIKEAKNLYWFCLGIIFSILFILLGSYIIAFLDLPL